MRASSATAAPKPNSIKDFTWRLSACAKVGDIASLKAMFQESKSNGIRPDLQAYNLFLHGFGNSGDIETVESVLSEMLDVRVDPDSYSYNALIRVCALAGNVDRAEEHFAFMLRSNLNVNAATCNLMITAHAEERVLSRMRDIGYRRCQTCV